jgi:iron complex outermembrane receptor protein
MVRSARGLGLGAPASLREHRIALKKDAVVMLTHTASAVPLDLAALSGSRPGSRPGGRSRRVLTAALFGATALTALAAAHPGRAQASRAQAPAATDAGTAQPASAVAEVTVTARHRSEDVETIPVAVSVLGGRLLEKTNSTNISQIAQLVPSLQFDFFNARNANINVRGLGNNIGLANDGLEPGVGFYVDGVYYDRPATTTFDLVDIDRIEVLRGPQGTLFGKNTTAGAINIATSAPSFSPQALAEVSGGNYGYFQAKASVAGPIIGDVLAGRVSVAATTREGLLTNVYNGNKVNAYQNLTLRGQLLLAPTDAFKLRLIADYSKQNTNCCDLVLAGVVSPPNGKNFYTLAGGAYTPRPGDVASATSYTPVVHPFARQADTNATIYARQETGGFSAQADWSLPKAAITSVTAWRFWNWWPSNDADYTPLAIVNNSQNGDYQTQISQELRIASTGANRVDYSAGLYAFHEQIQAVGKAQYGDAGSAFLLGAAVPSLVADDYTLNVASSYSTTSLAAFGQAVWHVASKWNLTGGLRYTYDEKYGSFNQVASVAAGGYAGPNGVTLAGTPYAAYQPYRAALGTSNSFSVTDNQGDLSGQADISYQAADNLLTYVNYAKGYKSGGLNLAQLPAGVTSPLVKPESIDSVEAGVKARLFDRRLTVNADVFWEQDDQYQANNVTALGKQYLSNVPRVRSEGVEADLRAQPTDNLSLYASVTYDDAIYADYPAAPCPLERINLPTCNLSGAALAGVPRWAVSAGGEYQQPFTIGARQVQAYVGADYTFRSSVYSAATDSVYSNLPQLSLLNARIGVRSADQRWDAYLWSKNLGATKYFTFISAAVGNTGALVAQLGDPQTFGGTIRFRY